LGIKIDKDQSTRLRSTLKGNKYEETMMMDVKSYIDSSLPMMEKFKDSAPGTYRHCQNIAQLVETIAKELNLNVENLVVAATLHDIGKCSNPAFFIENQSDDRNPHSDLDPPMSYQYISRHLSDSVLRLTQLGIPSEIIRIVSEHHGDSIVKTIYAKAKEKYNGSTIEDHYRYKSCKPSSVESCVLMICDVVESACRALNSKDKLVNIKETVDRIVNGLTDDEQLDVLSIGSLRIIKRLLVKDIENIFHKRLDYDLEKE
jgi:putative nucleotidyltransferase with HDIG domain